MGWSSYNGGDYVAAKLDRITVNEDMGVDKPDDYYIALVYFEFDRMNPRKTGNAMMGMYSDDLVATLTHKGIADISRKAAGKIRPRGSKYMTVCATSR